MAGTVPLKAPKGSHVEAPNMEHDSSIEPFGKGPWGQFPPPNLSQFNLVKLFGHVGGFGLFARLMGPLRGRVMRP